MNISLLVYVLFIWILPVENNTIFYSLVQERLKQPKEYSENPREWKYEMNEQTKNENERRKVPGMVHNVEFSEPEGERSIQKTCNASQLFQTKVPWNAYNVRYGSKLSKTTLIGGTAYWH